MQFTFLQFPYLEPAKVEDELEDREEWNVHVNHFPADKDTVQRDQSAESDVDRRPSLKGERSDF